MELELLALSWIIIVPLMLGVAAFFGGRMIVKRGNLRAATRRAQIAQSELHRSPASSRP